MIYGYCRVSTKDQNLNRQLDSLSVYAENNNVKIDKVFTDKISGTKIDRVGYNEMKQLLSKGDFIIIKSLDRLGRKWDLIEKEYKWFYDNDISVILLDYPNLSIDLHSADTMKRLMNTIIFNMICAFSQMERDKISQRTKEGLNSARKRGKKLGNPKTRLSKETRSKVLEMLCDGISKSTIAKECNVSRTYVYALDK